MPNPPMGLSSKGDVKLGGAIERGLNKTPLSLKEIKKFGRSNPR
jgi:hypothetical protein